METAAVYTAEVGGPAVTVTLPAAPVTTCPPIHPPVPPSTDLGGCRVLVILTAEVNGSNTGNSPCSTGFMSVSIDSSAALDTNSLRVAGEAPVRASVTVLITGLTPGSHTFTAVYKNIGCGNGSTFNARQITVIPG